MIDSRFRDHDHGVSRDFLSSYEGRQPAWGPLGYVTFRRTYSRRVPDGNGGERSETWTDVVARVVRGAMTILRWHADSRGLSWDDAAMERNARDMYDRIWRFKFMPAGRGLWSMGTDYVYDRGSASLYNCSFVSSQGAHSDLASPFEFMMDFLMVGCGVGFDTLGAGARILCPSDSRDPFVVEDSREGWVALVRAVIDSFCTGRDFPAVRDYSRVRPKGSPIRGFGGTASGHGPLEELVQNLKVILTPAGDEGRLTTTRVVDAMNAIGRCVVSGNIRRSAQIAFGSPDDEDFRRLKDWPIPNAYPIPEYALSDTGNPLEFDDLGYAVGARPHGPASWRWASNNSVVSDGIRDYRPYVERMIATGEPGFVWMDNIRRWGRMADDPDDRDARVMGMNPCGEICLEDRELCNLVETCPSLHDTADDYVRTLELAFLYAKAVSILPTHHGPTNEVVERNRRIGISQTGIHAAVARRGLSEHVRWCERGYGAIRGYDRELSAWLGVSESVRVTTVKPSGTTSLLPGLPAGMHPPHAEHYVRRIRMADDSPLAEELMRAGVPHEPCRSSASTTVFEFPVRERDFGGGKRDTSAREMMGLASVLQRHWSDNSVSVTVNFSREEQADLPGLLSEFDDRLKAVSFLAYDGDHVYVQPPLEEISAGEYETRAAHMGDVGSIRADVHDREERFCTSEACEIGS